MKGKNCYKRKMEFVSRKRNKNVKESNIIDLIRKDNEYEYSEPFNDKTNFQQPVMCNNIPFETSVNNHDITFDCNVIKPIPIQNNKNSFIPIKPKPILPELNIAINTENQSNIQTPIYSSFPKTKYSPLFGGNTNIIYQPQSTRSAFSTTLIIKNVDDDIINTNKYPYIDVNLINSTKEENALKLSPISAFTPKYFN